MATEVKIGITADELLELRSKKEWTKAPDVKKDPKLKNRLIVKWFYPDMTVTLAFSKKVSEKYPFEAYAVQEIELLEEDSNAKTEGS